jgi:hypothetical protein
VWKTHRKTHHNNFKSICLLEQIAELAANDFTSANKSVDRLNEQANHSQQAFY